MKLLRTFALSLVLALVAKAVFAAPAASPRPAGEVAAAVQKGCTSCG